MNEEKLQYIMDDLRRIVKIKRKSLKWSQKELSDKTGISSTSLGEFERGQSDINLINFIKIINSIDILDDVYLCLKSSKII